MTERIDLQDLRKQIVEVTLEIFRLCGERLQLAKKIGEIKARERLPLEDLKVEEELRTRVLEMCSTREMSREFCVKVLELLIDESKRVQREVLISKT